MKDLPFITFNPVSIDKVNEYDVSTFKIDYMRRFLNALYDKTDTVIWPLSMESYIQPSSDFSFDQSFILTTLYDEIMKERKDYAKSHPKLMMAGGSGSGTITVTREEQAALDEQTARLLSEIDTVATEQGAIGEIEMAEVGGELLGPEVLH